jgi:filamentous hemagglutinin family protein
MNHSYQSLWNAQTGTFVAVPENASRAGKKTSSRRSVAGVAKVFALNALGFAVLFCLGGSVYALPVGGVVVAGSASISSSPGTTTITQTTQSAAVNWQKFNISVGEHVQINQPNSSSVLLNRVLGADPSSILGSLSANGKVFLVNPNGILFGPGASVNVGGLVASTLSISDSDFMAGRYKFIGAGGSVLNQGTINAADGGYVALLGAQVENDGTISARQGSVALAAGQAITLDMIGDGLLQVTVGQAAVNALARNGGVIQSDGGHVLLSTQAASSLLPSVVNNTGVIQAQTIENRNGTILLLAGMHDGTVQVSGRLDASAPNGGDGGFIETSAAHVVIDPAATISTLAPQGKTGLWLLDPVNWVIATAGGDETPAQVTDSLALSDRLIVVDNDITVADAVTWTTPRTLELRAGHDVKINAAMTASTAGSGIIFTAGNDVLTTAAITASAAGSVIEMSAGNNVSVGVITADGGGSMSLRANHNVVINGALSADGGAVVLRADNDGTGPGTAGGTVSFIGAGTISAPNTSIRFNPVTYLTTSTEIANYTAKVVGNLDAKAWVFAQGNNKLYDGTTNASLSFRGTPTDGGDVSLTPGTANFDDKNVGVSKAINYAGYSLSGADIGKFELFDGGTGTTTANITPRAIVGSITASNKVYDGNNLATLNGRTLAGAVGLDDVSYTGGSATFTNKQAADGKTVTGVNLLLAGTDATNYTVNATALTTANITPRAIVGSITASNKVYDGNNLATLDGRTLTGVVGLDDVSYTGGSATFANKQAADGKTVTGVNLLLAGTDATNYTVNATALTTANITPRAIVGSITAGNKVYDGNNLATLNGRTLTGVVGLDDVTYTGGTGRFDTASIGAGKTVTGSGLGLSGTSAGNYTVNPTATTTAAITLVVVPPPVVVVPPGDVIPPIVVEPPDDIAAIESGEAFDVEHGLLSPSSRVIRPTWMPLVERAKRPPQLLVLAPLPAVLVPIAPAVPADLAVPVEEPVEDDVFMAADRPPKQDRN